MAGIASILANIAAKLVKIVRARTGSVGGWFWQVDGVVYREIKGPSPIVSLAIAHRLGDPSTLVQHFVAHARARQL